MWQTKYASAVTKNLGLGLNFRPCSEAYYFLSGRPQSMVSNLEMLCFLLSLILDISDIRAFIKVMIKPELKRFPLDIFQLHCRRFENRISNYSIFSLGSHTSMIFQYPLSLSDAFLSQHNTLASFLDLSLKSIWQNK